MGAAAIVTAVAAAATAVTSSINAKKQRQAAKQAAKEQAQAQREATAEQNKANVRAEQENNRASKASVNKSYYENGGSMTTNESDLTGGLAGTPLMKQSSLGGSGSMTNDDYWY